MCGLQLPRSRSAHRPSGRTAFARLARGASARWLIPFQCPDGSTAVDGRLIVETDDFIDAGMAPDPNPPLRVGFAGLCPDGTFSWGFVQSAPTQFDPALTSVSVAGTFFDGAGQPRRAAHVSVDASWTGTAGRHRVATARAAG